MCVCVYLQTKCLNFLIPNEIRINFTCLLKHKNTQDFKQ